MGQGVRGSPSGQGPSLGTAEAGRGAGKVCLGLGGGILALVFA